MCRTRIILRVSFLLMAIAVGIQHSASAIAKNTKSVAPAFPYKNFRLPDDLVPTHYKLDISIDLKTNFSHSGTVEISVNCAKPTNQIILHSAPSNNSRITKYSVTDSATKQSLQVVRKLESEQMIALQVATNLVKGKQYKLVFAFQGIIWSTHSVGFFRSVYKTSTNEERYVALTIFQPAYARFVFPCFDEPNFKAVFNISISHDKNLKALSNMPLDRKVTKANGIVQSIFQPTLRMSTYQVAFFISDFNYIEETTSSGTKIRVWATDDTLQHFKYGLSIANQSLPYFEKYLGNKYEISKLDFCIVSDISALASENWGLIVVREAFFIYNPKTTTVYSEYYVPMLTTHEIAHQWFGGLVTLKWWDENWLNQGIANYLQFLAVDIFEPEWHSMDFFSYDREKALSLDSQLSSRAIIKPVTKQIDLKTNYDVITYSKSACIIYMLKEILGEANFKQGLQLYVKNNAYRNTKADDFFDAFQKVTKNLNIKQFLQDWMYRQGFPVVTLERKKYTLPANDVIILSQKRFLTDSHNTTNQNKTLSWYIPLTYTTSKSPSVSSLVWMNKTTAGSFSVPSDIKWIKANFRLAGFFRVNYDKENWKQLIKQLLTDHTVFPSMDRIGLINDAFELAKSNLLDYKTALSVTSYLAKETHVVPVFNARFKFFDIYSYIIGRPIYDKFKKYMISIFKPILKHFGWKDGGSYNERRIRGEVLWILAILGDPDVVKVAKNKFHDWMKNDSKLVETHLRIPVYIAAVKYGNGTEWEYLWKKYDVTNDPSEKFNMRIIISVPPKVSQQKRFFKAILTTKKFSMSNFAMMVDQILKINTPRQDMAFKFFKDNFSKILALYGEDPISSYAIVFELITKFMSTDQYLQEVTAVVNQYPKLNESIKARQAIETIKTNIKWLKNNENDIGDFLKDQKIT